MPDFIATLIAAIVFCIGVIVLNALTALAIRLQVAPADLAQNSLVQYGLAMVIAHTAWRIVSRRGLA